MSLFDSASLVVTPNGYKATKLYSVIPSDGTGDMTFARAGNTATRVNASGYIQAVNADIPRLDYTGGGCPKLLLEPQRTNLVTYSNDFENAAWTKTETTITANSVISPEGIQNADSLNESTTSNAFHRILPTTPISGTGNTSYTFSVFVKPKGSVRHIYFLAQRSVDGIYAHFNMSNFSVHNSGAEGTATFISAKIESYPNGWYKLSLSGIVSTFTSDYYNQIYLEDTLRTGFTAQSYTGDGNSGFYLYGWQIEAGSYATSYIPTTTASVTRNADVCTKDSATALIGQTEGVVFSEFNLLNVGDEQQLFYARSGAGVYSNLISIYVGIDKKIYVFVNTSTTQFSYSSPILSTGKHKVSLGYKTNDFVVYIDGVQRSTSNSGSLPSLDRIKLGNYDDGGIRLASLFTTALWKTRLSNTDLAALTSL